MSAQSRKPVKKKLTIKEAKLVKGIVEGKTKRQAAIEAYNTKTPETASVVASNVLKKVNVQEALQEALEKAGLTPSKVVDVVKEGMEAQRLVIVGNGEEAMADLQPDHSIRLKAAGMAANFMGLGKNNEPQGNSYHFTQINNDMGKKYAD